jgi:hypothetical protein
MAAKRPWAMRARVMSLRGSWSKWRTRGTFVTEERALRAAIILKGLMGERAIPCEARVEKRSEP